MTEQREDFTVAASKFAHRIRLDEREAVVGVFRLVMADERFRHRHVDDAAEEIIDDVAERYESGVDA